MSTHSFTLNLPDVLEQEWEALAERLHEAGCDDALFGAVNRVAYLDFDREAESRAVAITSAIKDLDAIGIRGLLVENKD